MRRKTERGKKTSPEKVDRPKRRSTRNRKQGSSSESDEAAIEKKAIEVPNTPNEPANVQPEANVAKDSVLDEEKQDQVWQVKTTDASDVGEIKKLKICLTTRPPSTPERCEQSPLKKKHHRNRSDTTSSEGGDEKRKSHKHKSKRSHDSKDDDKSYESSQNEDPAEEGEIESKSESEVKTASQHLEISVTPCELQSHFKIDNEEKLKAEVGSVNKDNLEKNIEVTKDESVSKIECLKDEANMNERVERKMSENDVQSESHEFSEFIVKNIEEGKSVSRPRASDSASDSTSEQKRKNSEENQEKGCTKKHQVENHQKRDESPANDTLEINHKVDESLESEEKIKKNLNENNKAKKTSEVEKDEPSLPPINVTRKRRWGTKASTTVTNTLCISTDSLKNIISDPVKPVEFSEVMEERKQERKPKDKVAHPVLPKIVIDNTNHVKESEDDVGVANRKISIMNENSKTIQPPSPSRNKTSSILYITNLVRPFTLTQLKNLLQRTGQIVEDGFWIDNIKSKCYVQYECEDQAIETRHALHGVTWPVSNPKTLNVDFSTQEAFDKAKNSDDQPTEKIKSIGTVEEWLKEQDAKRDRIVTEDSKWDRRAPVLREWDVGKGEKEDRVKPKERFPERRQRSLELSPEPVRKFKKKEDEAPAKLLDDLFRKTKATPCIYWLPLSEETIAIKEEQRRKHMEEHERRMQEMRNRRRF